MLCADSVDNLMPETHELGGSAVVVDRATPKVSGFELPKQCQCARSNSSIRYKQSQTFYIIHHVQNVKLDLYISWLLHCTLRKTNSDQSTEWTEWIEWTGCLIIVVAGMVHTMHTYLLQLDMLPLVLQPYTTIQARFMEVSYDVIFFFSMPGVCSKFQFLTYFLNFIWLGAEPPSSRGLGKKIFVGRLPQEATSDDLRQYFGRFGHILDVYVPKVGNQTDLNTY